LGGFGVWRGFGLPGPCADNMGARGVETGCCFGVEEAPGDECCAAGGEAEGLAEEGAESSGGHCVLVAVVQWVDMLVWNRR
jgi:hypothetical protein